jgi:trypsin
MMQFFAFLILVLATVSNGQNFAEPNPYLVGGAVAAVGEFPSAVFIRGQNLAQVACGGTIVDREHVLTSAQCVVNTRNLLISPFWLTIVAGDNDLLVPTSRREVRNVTRIYVHPNFNPNTRRNDLAVLRVGAPFPAFSNTVETAERNTQFRRDGTACRLAAWGATSNNVNAPIQQQLRAINAPILARAACNANNVHANRVLDVHLCAGSIPTTSPNSGACQGNIGSGLYCNNILTGILSFGQSCGTANNPGVYIDVRRYNDWIVQQFTRTDNPQPGWASTPN